MKRLFPFAFLLHLKQVRCLENISKLIAVCMLMHYLNYLSSLISVKSVGRVSPINLNDLDIMHIFINIYNKVVIEGVLFSMVNNAQIAHFDRGRAFEICTKVCVYYSLTFEGFRDNVRYCPLQQS